MKVRLGTRGSNLAMVQSNRIASELRQSGLEVEIIIIRTSGDQSQAPRFSAIGPQGVFVREIENALLANEIDLAVHSYKDLPSDSPGDLVIAAVPERVDPADILVSRIGSPEGTGIDNLVGLPEGALVGTASARRQVWLEHFRPDLKIESLRGNVPTRLKRLSAGDFDAIVLAAAGVQRLQADDEVLDEVLGEVAIHRLDPDRFVPAPSQGALAIQCRGEDAAVRAALAVLDHAPSHRAVAAERAALSHTDGGCDVAFGAYCTLAGDDLHLTAMLERGGIVRQVALQASSPEVAGREAIEALTGGDGAALAQ